MIMFIAIDRHSYLYGKGTSVTSIDNNKIILLSYNDMDTYIATYHQVVYC